jgi:membrane protein DedA with SNARE-associated domain
MTVLLALAILICTLVIAALIEPSLMFWLCARLIAHAEAVQSYRHERRESTRRWDARLWR